jgi:hypothetical protein
MARYALQDIKKPDWYDVFGCLECRGINRVQYGGLRVALCLQVSPLARKTCN